MAFILKYMSYSEFIKLIICLTIDGIEYIIPILLTPLVGDLFDIIGLTVSISLFKWLGLISVLDLIPGLDIIPINTITWLIWMISSRREDFMDSMRHFPP